MQIQAATMIDLAAPVIQHYWTDLAHDIRTIEKAPEGSAFLWAPYSHGTRLITLAEADAPNLSALSSWQAMNAPSADVAQWYWISAGNEGKAPIAPVSHADASALARTATESAERDGRYVSRLHL